MAREYTCAREPQFFVTRFITGILCRLIAGLLITGLRARKRGLLPDYPALGTGLAATLSKPRRALVCAPPIRLPPRPHSGDSFTGNPVDVSGL
jgi:hypothetical protein